MSPRRGGRSGARVRVGTVATPRAGGKAKAGGKVSGRAKIAAEIASQAVKEASPAALRSMLQALVAKGEVTAGLDPDLDLLSEEEEELRDQEPEIDLGDPDALPMDDEDSDPLLVGTDEVEDESWPSERFEILVSPGRARFEPPDWVYGWLPASPTGKAFLVALDRKLATYARLASWLERHRPTFLASRDLWDLGPADREEILRGDVAVTRRGLLRALALEVDESTFSRYCQHASLVWSDGSATLEALFSREACLAWAGCGIARMLRGPITSEDLDYYRRMPAPKSGSGRRQIASLQRLASATAGEVVHRLCLEVNVPVAEVIDRHGERIRAAVEGVS